MLRCVKLGLSIELMNYLTVGDVYDLLIEQGNDFEEYPVKGTRDDIKTFF